MLTDNVRIFASPETLEKIQACAGGSYQASLLNGDARWSGGDLRGAAREYSHSYMRSRRALLKRLRTLGNVHVGFARGDHNRLVLVLDEITD